MPQESTPKESAPQNERSASNSKAGIIEQLIVGAMLFVGAFVILYYTSVQLHSLDINSKDLNADSFLGMVAIAVVCGIAGVFFVSRAILQFMLSKDLASDAKQIQPPLVIISVKEICGQIKRGGFSDKESAVFLLTLASFFAAIGSLITYFSARASATSAIHFYASDSTVIASYSVASIGFIIVAGILIGIKVLKAGGLKAAFLLPVDIVQNTALAAQVFVVSLMYIAPLWMVTYSIGTQLVPNARGEDEWLSIAVVCASSAINLILWWHIWRELKSTQPQTAEPSLIESGIGK